MLIKGTFHTNTTQVETSTFEVSGVNSIHFTLLKGAFEHFFVIIKDPTSQIRAVLSYKTRIKEYCLTTSLLTSDNNTKAGELPDGTWTVQVVRTYPIVGGYEVQIDFDLGCHKKDGMNPVVTSFEELSDSREGWYKGDFHMHSAYTDGRISHEEIVEAALHKKLDFICMSDHSTLTTKFPKSSLTVVPSTEVTWDDDGHYNIHGFHEFPDYAEFIVSTNSKDEALMKMFNTYHKEGCLLSINHPFPEGWVLKHNYDIRSFQTLEVINAPHLMDEEVDNERAIRFFDFLWSQGHYVYGIGGSDAHKKNYFDTYPIAVPQTNVYCKGLSIQHILEAAKVGHSYIQVEEDFEIQYRRPGKPKDSILPGEQVEGSVELKARCKRVVHWELIKNGELYTGAIGKNFKNIIDIKENEYYRLQARDEEGNIMLFVNPIHNMKNKANEYQFQKLLNGFYHTERK